MLREYVRRYGSGDAAGVDAAEFAAPLGLFLIALLDGAPVAIGGWRRLDTQRAEIKRMFVVESARGRGLARRILAELESSARDAGAREVVLMTGTEQPEAVALYESSGYRPIADFGYYAGEPRARFYGKPLCPS